MASRSKFGKILLVSGIGLATLGGLMTPAGAADTTATFTLTAAGGLAVTAPTSADLGTAATGAAALAAVQLGEVEVADTRGAFLGAWTASVTSSDFITEDYLTAEHTTPGAEETIEKANADYFSGAATSSSGTAVYTPGQPLAANAVDMSASRTAFSASAVVGNGAAAWNPTVTINIPSDAVAGAYEGTITHSVA